MLTQTHSGMTGRAVFITVLLVAFFSLVPDCLAQDAVTRYEEFYGAGSESGPVTVLLNVRSGLYKTARAILLIAGLTTLLLATVNMMQGDSSSAKRMFLWGIGLALGLALLSIVSTHGSYSASGRALSRSGDFSSIKMVVGSVLSIILSLVSMVTLTVVSIHVMKGERDGIEKFIKWLVVSVIGMALLNIV